MGVLDPNTIAELVSGNTMFPPSPDQGGMSPVVENAPQSKPSGGGLKGFLTTAFKNFMSGAGEAGEEAAGINDAAVKKANVKSAAVDDWYKQKLGQQIDSTIDQSQPIALPDNVADFLGVDKGSTVPKSSYGTVMAAYIRMMAAKYASDKGLEGKQIKATADANNMVPFPAHLAQAAGMPDQAGKPTKLSDISGVMRALGITSTQVTTADGVFDYDEISGTMKRLGSPVPSLRPLQDPVSGEVTGTFNSKTGQVSGGGRLNSLPGTELSRRGLLQVMSDDITTLKGLAERNPGKIGAVAGRISSVLQSTVGDTDEAVDLFRLSDNMADILLRARSGAQINESEYNRLRKLVPDPRSPLPTFMQRLKSFSAEVQRMQEYTGTPNNAPSRSNGSSSGMVIMKAPDGTTRPVPKDRVEFYKSKGATVVVGGK